MLKQFYLNSSILESPEDFLDILIRQETEIGTSGSNILCLGLELLSR